MTQEQLDADDLEERRRIVFWKAASRVGGVVPVELPPQVM